MIPQTHAVLDIEQTRVRGRWRSLDHEAAVLGSPVSQMRAIEQPQQQQQASNSAS